MIKSKLFLRYLRKRNATVPQIFQENVRKHPNKIAFHYQNTTWTYQQLDEYSNKVANCFLDLGFHSGQEIALFMESKPEFIGIWLGLAKAGIITALINTNLRLNSLIHSVTIVNCRAIIFSSELIEGMYISG